MPTNIWICVQWCSLLYVWFRLYSVHFNLLSFDTIHLAIDTNPRCQLWSNNYCKDMIINNYHNSSQLLIDRRYDDRYELLNDVQYSATNYLYSQLIVVFVAWPCQANNRQTFLHLSMYMLTFQNSTIYMQICNTVIQRQLPELIGKLFSTRCTHLSTILKITLVTTYDYVRCFTVGVNLWEHIYRSGNEMENC